MPTGICPECETAVYVSGETVICQDCNQELSVISTDPIKLVPKTLFDQVPHSITQDIERRVTKAMDGKRFANFILDLFILDLFIVCIFSFLHTTPIWPIVMRSIIFWSYLVSFLVSFFYYFVFELALQKTPAKYLTGTKVVKADGSRPSANIIIQRTLIRFIPFEPFSRGKGGWWHDRWTDTRVIND